MLSKRLVVVLYLLLPVLAFAAGKPVVIVTEKGAHQRVQYGVSQLEQALRGAGYEPVVATGKKNTGTVIYVGKASDVFLLQAAKNNGLQLAVKLAKEGYSLQAKGVTTLVTGADESGVLYGCIELAERITAMGKLPQQLSFTDAPEMVLRGTCIGLQKPTYLPGRGVYEYPYTPESFPWFYDKALWLRYLDSMAANRMNSLYLWNGHPFASLVRLPDYPYAVEVDSATFRKNEEIFRFLTTEADRRGIWVIQMFYNIILSKPFAEKHGLKTQDRNIVVTPLVADYTRKSIAAFVQKYPNVGLLITLGEALEGEEQEVDWFTKTIIPGVQDGLKAIGQTKEPPIVLRGHDTNPQKVMKAALPLYRNLYTMNKYNGEALTTYTPRGSWAQMHRDLSQLGSVHIDNVHILANLEPFRYGSADFIQKSVQAMHAVHGANGLHLYPEASYWDWPYAADSAAQKLLQIDRDWLWYKAWGRYAWNCKRDRAAEQQYWAAMLAKQFGTNTAAGKNILDAYEAAGEIAPKLLRRFGITNGNRQTLTLGITMSQLVNPHRYRVWPELYSSDGPEGEMLIEWAEKEWKKLPHVGETPMQVIDEVVAHGRAAVAAMDAVRGVTSDVAEFERLRNDMAAYAALAECFEQKVRAAALVLRYKYSNDVADLKAAIPMLERSVAAFSKLADLTRATYRYANSMQTGQRKVPVGGDGGRNKTWVELLPFYQKELAVFKRRVDSLSSNPVAGTTVQQASMANAAVAVLSNEAKPFQLNGGSLFTDTILNVKAIAAPLKGLQGYAFARNAQVAGGTTFRFKTNTPVKVLVAYVATKGAPWLQAPNLEVDANANDRGQAEVKIANALLADGLPPVNVHAYSYPAGTHTLTLGKGAAFILGVVPDSAALPVYDAALGKSKEVDWLFE